MMAVKVGKGGISPMYKTAEDYTRIATDVYGRHFKGYYWMKEDLVQEGVCNMWAAEVAYDESKGCWSTFMYKCCLNAMMLLIRRENKHLRNVKNISLDEIQDIIPDESTEEIKLSQMGKVYDCLEGLSPRTKGMACEWLNGTRQVEIANKYSVSRQHIGNIKKLIRRKVTERYSLDAGELVDRGEKEIETNGKEA